MFFYIGDDCPIKLNQVAPRLFLDDGWKYEYGVWYKGYSTECRLKDSISDIIEGYKPAGKWCLIHGENVYHPLLRGFPVYSNETIKTNLKLEGLEWSLYQTPDAPDTASMLSLEQASQMIGDILVENTINLYRYNKVADITAIFSAGLDTMTAWAIIDQVTKHYTVSVHIPTVEEMSRLGSLIEADTDNTNTDLIRKLWFDTLGCERNYTSGLMEKVSNDYWGYHHACFYKEQNWNITGYYAEVYTYRDGEAINAIANYYGKRIDELAREDDYLHWFLKRPNIVEKYRDSKLEFSNDEALKKFLWSTIWYDHQMWHLDNNLMFCPFADIRIPMIIHRMSVADIALNSVTGQLQRNIVKRFRPDLLPMLSDYKNEKNVWENTRTNFNESSMIGPNTKIIYR